MGRLIDADRAIESMQYYHDDCAKTSEYTRLRFETAIEVVKDVPTVDAISKTDVVAMFDKIKAEILACLKALDEIEKSGLNIYLPNEISGRRLTYQQCLEFIDEHKVEMEVKE